MLVKNYTISLPGYRLVEQLYCSSRTVVYRALKEISAREAHPVVVKLLEEDYPSFSELLQFRNQYTITKNLNIPGIVRPYALEPYRNGYALVMEDFGGVSLREYMQTTDTSLVDVLSIGLEISNILYNVHQKRVIHKDIKPDNILINPQTGEIKLIDFSIASLLPKETQEIKNINCLEGTLPYLSPEQTGRMNRGIDYRADFYALGVTFYELLTGELPFKSDDPMELVHSHIAITPPVLWNRKWGRGNGEKIPQVISDIVMKLMAKNAEDRYQSALGLKHDLEKCLYHFKETGKIEYFEIGQKDICDRFIIPEKLYGREKEVKELLTAFERVSQGNRELMLVSGFSGIGKTAVVSEVHKPIIKQRGYFIKGKFDQFNRNIPLSAFVQAFRNLMTQLLSETDAQLLNWKNNILRALGDNGQVIIEVIPELEKIIGKQPAVTELSGTAAQNRFNLLFQKFIQVFTTKEHPLVIFLDDLQWADSASLQMMQLLMCESSTYYLLMIGAYRDNEVDAGHPLMLTIEEIRKFSIFIHTITLSNLNKQNVNKLVADTLNCSVEIAIKLTQIVYQKTKGNPFFTTQFLKGLYQDDLIKFDFHAGLWVCDIIQLRALSLTDNVVEFMVTQLLKLPESTQDILKLAACIGNQFDLETLAIILETSKVDTANALWKALQSGLILPQSEVYKFYVDDKEASTEDNNIINPGYRFLHDRVQQAAYFLIPEEHKQITHYKLGKLLLDNLSSQEREDRIFDIVNQLNFGISLIATQAEKSQLARLNLIAGTKAKAATAYSVAFNYFAVGRDLLGIEGWNCSYPLTLALYQESAETAYLNTDFDAAEQFVEVVLQKANTLLDKINIYITQIHSNIAQVKLLEAIKIALEVLKIIDKSIDLPQEPSKLDFQQALAETQSNLADKPIADLLHLAKMENPHKLAAMRILASIAPPAYFAFPALMPLIAMKMVNLSIKFGNTSSSAFAYAMYGFLLCGVVNDIESGSQFGQLALNLVEKFNAKDSKSKVLLLAGHFIKPWQESLQTSLSLLTEAYQVGLEAGDLEFAGYSASFYCFDSILAGKELAFLKTEISAYSDAIAQLKQEHILHQLYISQQMVLHLLKSLNSEDFYSKLIGEAYDEVKMIPVHERNNNRTTLAFLYLAKLQLCYLFGNYKQANSNALKAKKYLDGVVAMPHIVVFYFYDSLVKLARFRDAKNIEQSQIKEQLEENQSKMRYWSDNAPMNCLHKLHLIEAEKVRVLGNKAEAIELYDQAISGAKENNFIHEEALANELAAKFYLDCGKDKFAAIHMQEAYYCYARWGAKAKTDDLEKRYSQLLQPILKKQNNCLQSNVNYQKYIVQYLINESIETTLLSSKTSDNLDCHSIIKATQALSSEIKLEQLIAQLIQLVMENSGAKKSALLLFKNDNLILEAIATIKEGFKFINLAYQNSQEIPISIINYVKNSLEKVILNDATVQNYFISDKYFTQQKPLSLLCMPILKQGKLIGLLYLENNLTIGAFTHNHIEVLNLLVTQAAISLENAQLYQKVAEYSHTLEQKVEERTQQLTEKATQLESTLQKLQRTQSQLIQAEKMSGLGQLVAGIAHEINNPISFIYGNLTPANEYVESFIELINLYEKLYPQPLPEIESKIIDLDLDFIIEDLPKLLDSMKIGTERIREIVISLRNFSRLDEAGMKSVDIHSGIDSTLLILQHQLASNNKYPKIEIIKEYNDIPKVMCYASELNQVFMNIISNAIDALRDKQENKPRIIIQTSNIDCQNILISIADNGIGISQSILNKIFDPFFTTKPVGSGTGLGLSTSYSIVVEKHAGKLSCVSIPGEGTEFIIQLPIKTHFH